MQKGKYLISLFLLIFFFCALQTTTTKADESFQYVNITIEESDRGISGFTNQNSELIIGSGQVVSGEQIRLYAEANSGYRFICWIYYIGDKQLILSDNQTPLITVNKSYRFLPFYIKEDNFVVKVLSDQDLDKAQLLSIQELESGANVNLEINSAKKQGFNPEWSSNGKNITTDTTIYLTGYKSSVWTVFRDFYPMFFKGLAVTIIFSIVSVLLAIFLGAVLCLMRLSNHKIIQFIATTYIEVIRGVPLLLQLLLIYIIFPRINIQITKDFAISNEVLACIFALFINSAAYVAEIFRSGISSVDKGQTEAARALGLSKWQTMRKVVLPQGFKNSLPSLANELIAVIKETSLASSVDKGIGELMSVREQIRSATFITLEPFIIIAIMYFIVTFSLSKGVRYIERRLNHHD